MIRVCYIFLVLSFLSQFLTVLLLGNLGGGGYGFMGTWERRQQRQHEIFSTQRLCDCVSQRGIPGCVEAIALGASESAVALGASQSAAARGSSASTATGPASHEAMHTFTLDSGASRCSFSDCTTVTPLASPVPISLADPTGGPIVARASIVFQYLAVPSGSHSGLHLPSFSTNLVSNKVLQDVWVATFIPGGQRVAICTCSLIDCHLATFTWQPGSSLHTLTIASAHVPASGQVAASNQVSASSQLAASCSCRGPAPLGVSQVDPPPLVEPLEISSDSSGPAEGGDTAADDTAATHRSPCLETTICFPPRSSSPPSQPAAVDSGAAEGGDPGAGASGGAGPGSADPGAEPGGAETRGAKTGGAETGGADSGGAASPSGGGAMGARVEGSGVGQPQKLSQLKTFLPQQIRELLVLEVLKVAGAGGARATSPGGAAGLGGAGAAIPGRGDLVVPPTLLHWVVSCRTTLAALEFAPSSADPSLFLRTDTTLPQFYVLVYVDDLVFATTDNEVLALVKAELQERHTCTDLGEPRSYLGLQITRERARCTITLTQSHMVHQVLQRFGFQYSLPQPTPLPIGHSLSAPPSDESVEPSGPYPELVGWLMYLMTCIRPDLAYPLSLLAHYVALGRHRKEHWDSSKRVLRYLCSTSGMGLVLGGGGSVVLTGHSDASWADDQATQRSSQGYTFSLGSSSISWRSTRSSFVLGSSYEAKIYAGAMSAQDLRWLTYLLTYLGERPHSPPVLYVVNMAMLALC
ncbi:unnamed protein product [Closterium sp. NIES-54]